MSNEDAPVGTGIAEKGAVKLVRRARERRGSRGVTLILERLDVGHVALEDAKVDAREKTAGGKTGAEGKGGPVAVLEREAERELKQQRNARRFKNTGTLKRSMVKLNDI